MGRLNHEQIQAQSSATVLSAGLALGNRPLPEIRWCRQQGDEVICWSRWRKQSLVGLEGVRAPLGASACSQQGIGIALGCRFREGQVPDPDPATGTIR